MLTDNLPTITDNRPHWREMARNIRACTAPAATATPRQHHPCLGGLVTLLDVSLPPLVAADDDGAAWQPLPLALLITTARAV